jgi:hypothetical protein
MRSDLNRKADDAKEYYEDDVDLCNCGREMIMKKGKLCCPHCDRKRERKRGRDESWQ